MSSLGDYESGRIAKKNLDGSTEQDLVVLNESILVYPSGTGGETVDRRLRVGVNGTDEDRTNLAKNSGIYSFVVQVPAEPTDFERANALMAEATPVDFNPNNRIAF